MAAILPLDKPAAYVEATPEHDSGQAHDLISRGKQRIGHRVNMEPRSGPFIDRDGWVADGPLRPSVEKRHGPELGPAWR